MELLALLGKSIDDPTVERAVSELSPTPARQIAMRRGTIDVRAREHGLDVCFKPAEQLRDGATLGVPIDGLVLTVIFFHAEGHEDYRAYTGALPRGLGFAQSRSAVHESLGAPSGSSTRHKNDRWDFDWYFLTVDFDDDERSIRLVTLGLPWKPRA
jgi:hypothetical protein